MNREETVKLTRYVKGACPQQAIDEFTPNVWHDLIGDLALADCLEAVRAIVKRQPFVAPAEIRNEVKRIRVDRLDGFVYLPGSADEDTATYLRRLREQRTAVAAGQRPADPTALPPSEEGRKAITAALTGVFPTPPKRRSR